MYRVWSVPLGKTIMRMDEVCDLVLHETNLIARIDYASNESVALSQPAEALEQNLGFCIANGTERLYVGPYVK